MRLRRILTGTLILLFSSCLAPSAQADVKPGTARLGAGGVEQVEPGAAVTPPARIAGSRTAGREAVERQVTMFYGPLTLQPGNWYNAWAYCPEGMKATGGGESNPSGAGTVTLRNTYPLADGSGWAVTVNNSGSTAVTFKVFTVCFRNLQSYQQTSIKKEVAPGATENLLVACPSGYRVLGGGGTTDSLNVRMSTGITYGAPLWWQTSIRNDDGVPHTLVAVATCGIGVQNWRLIVGPDQSVPPGQLGSSAVYCTDNTWIVGGGGAGWDRVTDSFPDAQGWRTYVRSDSASPGSVNVSAICGN
ncbi:hypothetical protein AB5J62_19305 [Amycolatopsis sp. cg5]|uniref:hypothetical protein n=1 Tax=Amycolatopsis sp. cg5 TaxID=3238802 RepID=UPI0035241533